jgi:hypothetical protein
MNKVIFLILNFLTVFFGPFKGIRNSNNWNFYKLKTLYYTRTLSDSELYSLIDDFLKNHNSINVITETHTMGRKYTEGH